MKEIFDRLKEDCENYCLLVGWVDLHKDEDEPRRFYMQDNIQENEYVQKVGCFPHDLIRDSFGEHEWKVDKDGFYEFWCLLSFSRRKWEYEDDSYLSIEHIEYNFQISFEDRDKEQKLWDEEFKDTDLFGNKIVTL